MNLRLLFRSVIILGVAATGVSIYGQSQSEADPPELAIRRKELQAALKRATAPLLVSYAHSLEELKAVYVKAGNLKAALAVEEEITQVLAEVNEDQPAKAIGGITMIEVVYRAVGDPKRSVDITNDVRSVFESGAATIALSTVTKNDIAPGKPKEVVIRYRYAGKKREKSFGSGVVVNFKQDLK